MQDRIEKAKDYIKINTLSGLLISSVANISYITGYDNFSSEEREAYLLITNRKAHFFITKLYIDEVRRKASGFSFHTIGRDEPFTNQLQSIIKEENIDKIGFEEHDIRYAEFSWLKKVIPHFMPISLSLRVQKDTKEIREIKKACSLSDKALEYTLSKIEEGISEETLQYEIEIYYKKHLADSSFRPIVAFGSNTSIPHHKSGPRRLKRNEYILFDLGAKIHGYCSDMTRTVFFGSPLKKHTDVYNCVLAAQEIAIDFIDTSIKSKKTIRAHEVDNLSRTYIISRGFPPLPHSLGHGIGRDVHEAPYITPLSQDELRPGMVFSVEPGIYLPHAFGVRIEDLIVVTDHGVEILTHFTKKFVTL